MSPVYAVRVGHAPGIYYDIAAYEEQLKGYPGGEGRKFKTEEEARRYLGGEEIDKKGIYAVRSGRVPGIYYSLAECDAQVRGVEGAECKRFSTIEAAERYLRKGKKQSQNSGASPPVPEAGRQLGKSISRRLKKHPGIRSPLADGDPRKSAPIQRPALRSRRAKPIVIYTDGGCLVREDGAGGWAAVICLPNGNRKEISGGIDSTTSDRMELLAAVCALRTLVGIAREGAYLEINTDSRYLTDGCRKKIWLAAKERGVDLPNEDLWTELAALSERYDIDWCWVKGHSGNPMNERCDFLAAAAAKQSAAEKEFVHDYAGQLETAKRQIKDLEHQNRKLTHSKERFQFLARRGDRIADKNLYSAVHDGSIIGFLKWKFHLWREKK